MGARSREQDAQETTRRVEKEKDTLRSETREWKQEVDSLNRKLLWMENRINELEEDSKNQKVESDARIQRAEARVGSLKEERDVLMSERTKLLSEKEQLFEVHNYSAELEILIHKGKENTQILQHELTLKDQEVEVSKKEGQKWKQQLTEYEDTEAERSALYNKTVQSLRQEIFCLEERVRAAESDSENKLQTDMLAMIAMQNDAVERDAVLLKLREENTLLQSKNDAVNREKAVLMEKLVTERAKNDVLSGLPLSLTPAEITTAQLISCTTQTDFAPAAPTKADESFFQISSATEPLLLLPSEESFNLINSIEDMKKLITSSATEVTAAKQLISQKEEATDKLRQKMHERLYQEMQSLHSKTTTVDDTLLDVQRKPLLSMREHVDSDDQYLNTNKREELFSPELNYFASEGSMASTSRVSPPRRSAVGGRSSLSSMTSNSFYFNSREPRDTTEVLLGKQKESTTLDVAVADSTLPMTGVDGNGQTPPSLNYSSDKNRPLMSPRNEKSTIQYAPAETDAGAAYLENRHRDPLGVSTHALTSSAFPSTSERPPAESIWKTNIITPTPTSLPQPVIPAASVAEQYRKTEDDLCALRQRVVDLRGLQKQAQVANEEEAKEREREQERERTRERTLSPRVELVSHPIRTPIQNESPREYSVASTAIAMECIPPNHDPRLPSVSQRRSEVSNNPIAILTSRSSATGGSEIMRRLMSNACRDNEL